MTDDRWLDATSLATLVAHGDITPRDVLEEAIDRAEQLNPQLNAIIHWQCERARRDASGELPNGPFRGVPFLFKDYWGEERGEANCAGLAPARDLGYRASFDSVYARRIREGGAVPFGRTNVPELASVGTTEPRAFGPTHNPWDLDRSPGGSSGGSAAAVAAGIVPVAHANDIAGSIRIPAAYCGLVGLKPSRGRVVTGPSADPVVAMNAEGVVSRSVRDTAAFLDWLTEPHRAGPWPARPFTRPLVAELDQPIEPLRVGVLTQAPSGADVEAGLVEAATHTGTVLEELGHEVEVAHPEALFESSLYPDAATARWANCAAECDLWGERLGLGRPLGEADLEPTTWRVVSAGRALTGADLVACLSRLQLTARRIMSWWRDGGGAFDLLVTPAVAEPPPPLGDYLRAYRPSRASAFTVPFNVTGQPAVSLPLGWPDDGLPRGVQIVAGPGREDILIRIAAQLEDAEPWAHRHPPVSAFAKT
jgi:amidase